MKEDMKMRGFSHWTEASCLEKTKDIMRYFKRTIEETTIDKLINKKIPIYKKRRKIAKTINVD